MTLPTLLIPFVNVLQSQLKMKTMAMPMEVTILLRITTTPVVKYNNDKETRGDDDQKLRNNTDNQAAA